MNQVYLFTGQPGCGKTSLIKRAVARIKGSAGGFYTEEIRSGDTRQGFRLFTLDGRSAVLAHIYFQSPHRIGKYGVDIDSLDKIGVSAINEAVDSCDIVVIDEIGKMELLSAKFKQAVTEALKSGKKLLGTIMQNPDPFADAIKAQPQVKLLTVTRGNHDKILEELRDWLNPQSP